MKYEEIKYKDEIVCDIVMLLPGITTDIPSRK